jgi:hypothetical protein
MSVRPLILPPFTACVLTACADVVGFGTLTRPDSHEAGALDAARDATRDATHDAGPDSGQGAHDAGGDGSRDAVADGHVPMDGSVVCAAKGQVCGDAPACATLGCLTTVTRTQACCVGSFHEGSMCNPAMTSPGFCDPGGNCVECVTNGNCQSPPNVCYMPSGTFSNGSCTYSPTTGGVACGANGVTCDGHGNCT